MRARLHRMALLAAMIVAAAAAVFVLGCGGSSSSTSVTQGSTTTAVEGTTTSVAASPSPGPLQFEVKLSGAEAVPPVQTAATGNLRLTVMISGAGYDIAYELDVENLTDATGADVNLGAAGQNGEVIYPLFEGPEKTGPFTGTLAEGTFDPAKLTGPMQGKTVTDLATAVLAGTTYVVVRTRANPDGEIRGQITVTLPAGEVTAGQQVTTTTP